MRTKIIAVNVIIVAIVGLLSFVLMRSALMSAASNPTLMLDESKHAAQGAAARMQLDALRMERWVTIKANEIETQKPFNIADKKDAAPAAAKTLCDSVVAAGKTAPDFQGVVPTLAMLVQADGKVLGRDAAQPLLQKGDDVGAAYPIFNAAMAKNQPGADVWVNKTRQDQYLVAYAPVRNETGQVIGALVVGIQINDELSRVADATTGRAIILTDKSAEILARSAANTSALDTAVAQSAKATVSKVLETGHSDATPAGDMMVAASPLDGLGDGKSKVLVASTPATAIEGAGALAMPILGVMALGLILVIVAGWLLAGYITAPIGMLEEGLLAILNGQTDKRFSLDHAELGGLAFRIDQLLNQLMGVEEDTTDDDGRVSRAPTAAALNQSVGMDEGSKAGEVDPSIVARLSGEADDAYYARIFAEYIAAKKSLGEPTDHITQQQFVQRIQSMEAEEGQKRGKKVRYHVQTRNNEVTLLPVQL